ncbi:uncharacterized protein LOC119729466 [Patiria miniata]|uniref:SnoaL-like domain-containing protein n=1 Tax=Patiria miniata TaxID=46514 RepID=A0A914A2S5_PATMI|nr:uncharacterized protein LOC119729466 [Patiria miniata]
MSAFTWLCVFLLVGLLNTPIEGHRPPSSSVEAEDGKEENRGIADHHVVNEIVYDGYLLQQCVTDKDLDCILSYYAPDVIVVPDGHPSYQGIDQLSKNLGWIQHVTVTKHDAEHIEPLEPSGDLVLEVHAHDTVLPDGSHKKGKTALIWKRIHGLYHIIFEMYNDEY